MKGEEARKILLSELLERTSMPKLIVLKQDRGRPQEKKDHIHDNSVERFANRPDITFKRCKRCGWKEYPDGVIQVYGGSHTEILWPT